MDKDILDEHLGDYFQEGIEPSDLPALFPLQRARSAITSLMTVFSGSEAAVLARLPILDALKSYELPAVLRQLAQWMGLERLREQEGISLSTLGQDWQRVF